jgi:ribosome maturation factor RimP
MRDEQLTNLLAPVVAAMGLECLGVEFRPSHGNSLVRVYIDAADRAITVDDCEAVSREVSATLDVNDPVAGRYTLEVSSPGFDRPLFTPEQFGRFVGRAVRVEVNLPIAGRRRFQGSILAVEGEEVLLDQDGATVRIAHANIHKARLVPEYGDTRGRARKPGKVKR